MKRDATTLMDPRMSLQQSLLGLRNDWLGCELLSGQEQAADALARRLVACDPYGENGHLKKAFARVGLDVDDSRLAQHLAHRIWCEARDALWLQGVARPALDLQVEHGHWYQETLGQPTLLVLPMTMALVDSLEVIRQALRGRRCVVYGEGLDTSLAADGIEVAGQGTRAVRRINEVLAEGGVLCTYADFSYASHAAVMATVFGCPRPVSKGFLSLALRPGVRLLPVRLAVDSTRGRCTCEFSESLGFSVDADLGASDRDALHQQAADVVAQLLERSIAQAAWQWLLLPTLAFDTHQ
ncbi:MAG: hypothetical protein JNK17_16635 [Hydrogenophaga sp.]|nr:hypothetical protein [Hydrogenophaga sp.]